MAKYASLNAASSASSDELNYTEIAVAKNPPMTQKTPEANPDDDQEDEKRSKQSIWVKGNENTATD